MDKPLRTVSERPGLPRVLIIGDSISIGYTPPVRALLAAEANVVRIPVNGGSTTDGLANLDYWLGDKPWDVIHFNWGLHDLKRTTAGRNMVSLRQYEANLRQLVSRLKKTGAMLIWASTTPVPAGNLKPHRENTDVVAYNAAAVRIMRESDVAINDLYAFALPLLAEVQLPANVHLSPIGSEKLAHQVANCIRVALKHGRP